MSNKKKNKPTQKKERPSLPAVKKFDEKTKRKAKDMLIFAAITVAAIAVYVYFVQLYEFKLVFAVYLAVWSVSVIGYFVYNRGLLGEAPTEEMLSPHWSAEKKTQFIESIKERKEKSRWLLFIIAPITFVFLMEIFMVLLLPEIYEMLGIGASK